MNSLADRLNEAGVAPNTNEGKVVALVKDDDEGDEVHVELSEFGIVKGYIDEHPEGADRGGHCEYVFTANEGAYWRDVDGEWTSA